MLGFNNQKNNLDIEKGASFMVNSIQHFLEIGLKELGDRVLKFAEDPSKLAEFVYDVTDSVTDLGCRIIAEQLETFDEQIRRSAKRKAIWHIVRRDETSLLTSLGNVSYHKTLFRNKRDGSYAYLLDKEMHLESHVRVTEDAEAKALEEALESSYKKGGEKASISDDVISKQAVMKKIHKLEFPPLPKAKELKQLEYLYIDADEDHVALQYVDFKCEKLEQGRRHSVMPKIVYLYEGISNENGRNELVNPVYFGGLYEGPGGNRKLWEEVNSYILTHYDSEVLKRVYINGDGAEWIKAGESYINAGYFVLDKFHMHKYVIKATSHLGNGLQQARSDLYSAITNKDKSLTTEVFNAILKASSAESQKKVTESMQYILGNWQSITRQLRGKGSQLRCSAEGHVSHIYSARLSSRPLGWCKTGVDRMARLRIYQANKGNMLELVRYQKAEKVSGDEVCYLSSSDIECDLRRQRSNLGVMYGMKTYTIPESIKKRVGIRFHVNL